MKEAPRFESRSEYLKINRQSREIITALSEAPVYKKHSRVFARPALVGEIVKTVVTGDVVETIDTANEGDWVVTNPSGERYLLSNSVFLKRYEPQTDSDNNSEYQAIGYCRAIKNPFQKPIEIMASWDEPQRGDEECMIADTCDEYGTMEGEPYLIEQAAFKETYL